MIPRGNLLGLLLDRLFKCQHAVSASERVSQCDVPICRNGVNRVVAVVTNCLKIGMKRSVNSSSVMGCPRARGKEVISNSSTDELVGKSQCLIGT